MHLDEILAATVLFLLRFAIYGLVVGVLRFIWAVVRFPFAVVYAIVSFPARLLGIGGGKGGSGGKKAAAAPTAAGRGGSKAAAKSAGNHPLR